MVLTFLHLVDYILLFPYELKVEIIQHKLILASLTKAGLLVDLYSQEVLAPYPGSYILDRTTGRLILVPFENLDGYF